MSNPYEQFVVSKPAGAPEGNPYAAFTQGNVADEQEQELIAKVNNPSVASPSNFGLAEIPIDTTRGIFNHLFSLPGYVGQNVVEAGELSNNTKGMGAKDVAAKSFMDRFFSSAKANDGKAPGLVETGMIGLGVAKDTLLSFVADGEAPSIMVNAGNALVAQNKAALDSLGLAKDGRDGLAYDFGSGAGSILASVASTVITKDPKYAAGYMAMITNAEAYKEARAAGKTPQEAMELGAADAFGQGAIELAGANLFMGAAKASSFMRGVLLRASGQAAEEAAQQGVDEAIMNSSGVRNKTAEEIALAIGYSGLLGFMVGAPVSAVVGKMEQAGKEAGATPEQTKEIIDNFVKNKDDLINASAQLLDNETAGVTRDPNAPEHIQEIIKAATQEQQQETPSVTKVIESDYVAQADEIKDQISSEVAAYDISKPSSLRKAIGYVPETLSSFIKRTGGIVDYSGELKSRGIDGKSFPGMIRKAKGDQSTGELLDGATENDISGIDAVKQRVFDAGYFPEKQDYNQITDSELFDAIAADRNGKRRYNAYDQQKIEEYLAANPNNAERYAAMGITPDMSSKEIAEILRENDNAPPQTEQVTPDMNDPRFSGELDLANSSLNEKTIKSKRQILDEVLAAEKAKPGALADKFKENLSDLGRMAEAVLTPISTRLKAISPALRARMRKFEFDRNQQINADQAAVKPFLEKYNALGRTDRVILDFAMRNGDAETIRQIADKNNMGAEIDAVREALDGLYKRAKSVGLDIGYRKNFFPRYVNKPEAMLKYFEQTEAWNDIQQAIQEKELEIGRLLEPAEKAYLVNTLLRGYNVAQISLARPGALKQRMIDSVTPEINNFYGTTDQAILRYITTVNDSIETRKFFGKGSKINEFENIEDSIGYFVLQEMEAGNIKPADAMELSKIMKARFAQGKMSSFWRVYKNVGYIDTMGSPISAVTQLGDLAFSFYKSGVYRTLTSLPRAIAGKSEVTREDIGISQIAQEFEGDSTSAAAVRKVFKLVGLEKMDAIGKEVTINAALKRFRAQAKKPTQRFRDSLELIFGEETDAVINDLKNGKNSENVKLLLFNELLDLQPVALSEMPEVYLRSGNGRVFYMLKTYTVKQFDIYRNEVFNEIKANPVQGLKNLTRLLAFFVMMNAGADFLKDLLLNRDTPPEDAVVNNIARIFGLSKYNVYSARREGIGSAAFKLIAPPFKLIDSSYKDMNKAIEQGEVDVDDLESVASIPVVGKFHYWWFGAGSEK